MSSTGSSKIILNRTLSNVSFGARLLLLFVKCGLNAFLYACKAQAPYCLSQR
ncbi:Uncharacterised protein [[Pasteurella] mairii]|uniref:Uncharacterized protein n=1 Tax=[Pasteurella] mairii TaxID=757 RepID=A0A379B403_9PAST|nr:Uncharacterised protein [[Pasteurella] mairii]